MEHRTSVVSFFLGTIHQINATRFVIQDLLLFLLLESEKSESELDGKAGPALDDWKLVSSKT